MKLLILALLAGAAFASEQFHETVEEFEEEFNMQIADEELKKIEAEVLEEAEKQINENNKAYDEGKSTFKETLYQESILPKEEFEKEREGLNMDNKVFKARLIRRQTKRSMGLIMPPESERNGPENDATLAEIDAEMAVTSRATSYNAVTLGLVTDPKNQKSCGSCAAFAAQGLHEVCMIKAGATKKGLDLSEQYLVDCAYDGDSRNGCNGAGLSSYTDWFIKTSKGQGAHENAYKYTASKGTCQTVAKWSSGAKVDSFKEASNFGEKRLKKVISTNGAAIVGVYASDKAFENYLSGVYTGCTSKKANHAVLAVGYGTENGTKYWLVKNSWGTKWGEKGYFKIKRGNNECGIESAGMVYGKCSTTSKSDTVPATPTTAAPTAAMTCDLSSIFGTRMNGEETLQFRVRGKIFRSEVICSKSVCKPKNSTGITNACIYICGMKKCGR